MSTLDIINFEKLVNSDKTEIERLVRASQTAGVFHLDLRGPSARSALENLSEIYSFSAQYFNQASEIKQKDFQTGVERGFKQFNDSATFEIPRKHEDVIDNLPAALQSVKSKILDLSTICDYVLRSLLTIFGQSLQVEFPELDSTRSSASKAEATGLKLCYKNPTNNTSKTYGKSHTDSGLITLLFYDSPTLELSIHGEWIGVSPEDGCAVVNVADTLEARVGGKLHSPLHRVVQPAGMRSERVSAVYFLRSEE